jgi:hypothetical protein
MEYTHAKKVCSGLPQLVLLCTAFVPSRATLPGAYTVCISVVDFHSHHIRFLVKSAFLFEARLV